MAAIRSKGNKATDLKLVSIIRNHRITGWRRNHKIPGNPDFVFRREHFAIFVDGCFWHGCPIHCRRPNSNRAYWLPKILRNQKRDVVVAKALRVRGWRVMRIWEHDLRFPRRVARRVAFALQHSRPKKKLASINDLNTMSHT
jgi:DNA mismatch endonuclease (patch repair protein)